MARRGRKFSNEDVERLCKVLTDAVRDAGESEKIQVKRAIVQQYLGLSDSTSTPRRLLTPSQQDLDEQAQRRASLLSHAKQMLAEQGALAARRELREGAAQSPMNNYEQQSGSPSKTDTD